MAGGADPSAVLEIIHGQIQAGLQGRSTLAQAVVSALESSGYRIIRAGMVPRLTELERTVDSLSSAADVGLDTVDIGEARDTLRTLTELAVAVLGLDPDDRDDPDGTDA